MTTTTDDKRLNDSDMTILIEALEAWVEKDAAGELMGELIVGLVGADKKGELKDTRAKQKEDAAQSKKLRKEQSILLQGKLIRMRDALVADGALEPAQ